MPAAHRLAILADAHPARHGLQRDALWSSEAGLWRERFNVFRAYAREQSDEETRS